MRKTKTRTRRKSSRVTRKKRGGATYSSPTYKLVTEPLGGNGRVFNSQNITNEQYQYLVRRIKGDEDAVQPLDASEIHLVVNIYHNLKRELNVTDIPTNVEHIIHGNHYTIVARYPRLVARSPERRRGRSRSLSPSSPRDRKRSLSRSSSSSLGSK